MIPYLFLLLIPSIFALANTRRLALGPWYITFVIYVLFVGLRFEVGPDWRQYGRIHDGLAYADVWELVTKVEPLSHLLFWVSKNGGFEIYLSNFVAATIMMTGVFTFARRTANPWLALVSVTPYFIIVIGMSGIRQAMAAGVMLFLFARWEQYSFLRRGVYILMAALFHTSALVNNIFLIIKLNILMRYKIALGLLILSFTLLLSFELPAYADNVIKYQERYLVGASVNRSYGSLYHIAMIALPALLSLIYKERIINNTHNQSLLKFGLYAAAAVLLINIFSSTAASRLTIYMYFLPMMIYPALVSGHSNQSRGGSASIVIVYHIIVLVTWFTLGNVWLAYVPYQNLLLDDI